MIPDGLLSRKPDCVHARMSHLVLAQTPRSVETMVEDEVRDESDCRRSALRWPGGIFRVNDRPNGFAQGLGLDRMTALGPRLKGDAPPRGGLPSIPSSQTPLPSQRGRRRLFGW